MVEWEIYQGNQGDFFSKLIFESSSSVVVVRLLTYYSEKRPISFFLTEQGG